MRLFNDTKPIRCKSCRNCASSTSSMLTQGDWPMPTLGSLEIMARHADAVARSEPTYEDPATGLSVFTAAFLADRGYCCDSGCRHCPFVTD